MKALLRSSLVCLLSSSMLVAQSTSTTQSTAGTQSKTRKTTTRRTAKPAAAGDTTAEQLRELRDMLNTQQQQIRQLQGQLAASTFSRTSGGSSETLALRLSCSART